MKINIILASGSHIRATLLRSSGVVFDVKKHKIDEDKEKETLIKIGKKWKPYRSVATWYLWRSLDPIPVEY